MEEVLGFKMTQWPKNQQKGELQPPTCWNILINPLWALDHGMHATNILGVLNLSKEVFFFLLLNIRYKCLENNTCNVDVRWSIPIDEAGDTVLET